MHIQPTREQLKNAITNEALKRESTGDIIIGPNEVSHEEWLFDFRALLLQPKWLNLYAELFWEKYADQYPFQVCGMESAAISLLAAVSMKGVERGTPVNALFVRKSRKRTGLLKHIEGTPTSEPVIIVDDLINRGSTLLKQVLLLKEMGLSCSNFFALLAFREASTYTHLEHGGLRIQTIFTLPDFAIPFETDRGIPTLEPYQPLWKFSAPNPTLNLVVQKSAPILDADKIYFGSDAGVLYALWQKTGEIAWQFHIGKFPEGKGILSTPALYKNTLYFGAYDGNVYALNSDTGEKKWIYGDADWVGSSPALAPEHNLLFIGLEFGLWLKQGGIVALNIKSGKRIWEHRTPALTHGSPLYIKEQNMVVIGSNDSIVYAYEATSGALIWKYQANGEVKSSFVYDQHTKNIFFGSLAGQVYGLLAQSGEPIFSQELGPIYSTPAIFENFVYFSSLDKHVYALNVQTSKELWRYATNGRIFASPLLAQGSLWIGSNDGRLYELAPQSGEVRGWMQLTERIVNKVCYNSHTQKLFIPTQANQMYCVDLQNKNPTKP